MTTTSAPNQATPSSPFRRAIGVTLAVIAVLVVAFFVFASLYADWLWFTQLDFSSVLWTQWIARAVMFVVGFLAMAIPVFIATQLAYRLRPVYVRLSSQLDRYQEVIEPLRAHVEMTPDGWVVDVWPMTAQLAAIVQPWVDEPIDVESGSWFVSSAQVAA